jgi:hypothetical protein
MMCWTNGTSSWAVLSPTAVSLAFQKTHPEVCFVLTQVFVPHSLMWIGLQKRLRLRLKPPDPKESKF